ncbi:MAG: signal peptide peptidase SppA [Phycisphaerales bacterium]
MTNFNAPPPPPRPYASSPAPNGGPAPTVIEVVARRGGVSQAILFLVTLALFGIVLAVGISIGAVAGIAGAEQGGLVLESPHRAGPGQRVAIVGIEGAIGETLAEDVRLSVDRILADGNFRAVVLRVNSPGGAVSPSDRIWREIERLKSAGLPVVASYGGIAASGGVYASCGADEIWCEPTGITGSVGVIASVMTFGDLMTKVGIEPVTLVATGSPHKSDANDPYRRWTETDRAVIQGLIDQSYQLFVSRVTNGRTGKTADMTALRRSLDGRVMSADEAKDIGLVDGVGYLDDAIASAERRAGLPIGSANVVRLSRPRPFWADGMFGDAASALFRNARGTAPSFDAEHLRDALNELARPRIEYVFR